jgi:hypothetical protein
MLRVRYLLHIVFSLSERQWALYIKGKFISIGYVYETFVFAIRCASGEILFIVICVPLQLHVYTEFKCSRPTVSYDIA